MKFQKGISTLIGLVIIIAVAVVAIGGFFAYQKLFIENKAENNNKAAVVQDETANWKTYANEKLGYQIKYPNDWEYREYPGTQSGAGFRPTNKPNDVQYEFINIDARGTAESQYNVLFDEYVKTAAVQEIQNFEKLNSVEQITTNSGLKGYKTSWIYSDMTNNKKISLPITYFDYQKTIASNKYKTIQVSLGNGDYEKIYDQMLPTFKFTTSVTTCIPEGGTYGAPINESDLCCAGLVQRPTSNSGTIGICVEPNNEAVNWGVYTNTKYGFAMKYPDNFLSQEIIVKSFSLDLDSCPYIDRSGTIIDKTGQENNIRQGFVAQMDKITINNQTFCYKEMGEPAAGTVYYSDYYATTKNQEGFVMVLSTAAPNCQNYLPLEQGNDWQKQSYDKCLTANSQRPIILEKIMSTFKFTN